VWRGLGWKHRGKTVEASQRPYLSSQAGPTLDQVQMLEDRVRVLERIVTDRSHSLDQEIEALRDTPRRTPIDVTLATRETI